MADIRIVFDLIRSAGLRLKRTKCQFIKESVDYLGHVISKTGIAPDPAKKDKIANYKVPTSADEVRSFLGLAGYYRRFILNFGSIARPLTAKTHKDVSKNRSLGQRLTKQPSKPFVPVSQLPPFLLILILI